MMQSIDWLYKKVVKNPQLNQMLTKCHTGLSDILTSVSASQFTHLPTP